ncbi:MAG TPA: Crp/Fnr family transcriptional regulator [Anaerolineae bacterium]|nr:Crp/Fnr family transcriptional regulator [Anaerolineae bacterium]
MPTQTSSELLSKKLAFLRQVPLLATLRDPDLAALSQDLQLREYDKGETIFRQGDPGYDLFIILRGKIRIFRMAPSGHETSITIFGIGDIIGELAVVDGQPRSASARAIGPCGLLQITAERFLARLSTIPELALAVIRVLAAKTRWTAAYAEAVAQYDAAGRLLHLLLTFNDQFGEEVEKGKRYILDLGLNRADLASLIGVRREWINHLLHDWRKRGLLGYSAGKITILDRLRVEQERDSRIEANLREKDW